MVYDENGAWHEISSDPLAGSYYDPPPEQENLILVWDTSTGELVYQDSFTMKYQTSTFADDVVVVEHVEFLDKDRFLTVTQSGEVAIWSIPLQKRVYALSASALRASAFAVSSSLKYFVLLESNLGFGYGNIGQQAVFYDKHGLYRQLNVNSRTYEKIETTPMLRIWHLADGRLLREVETPVYNSKFGFPREYVVKRIHFSPDEKLLAFSTVIENFLLDVEDGILIEQLPTMGDIIGFTVDGKNLLIQKADNQVNVWNIQQERFYKNFAFPGKIYYTQMVSDNRAVVVINEGKDSIAHVVDLGEMMNT